MPRLSELREEDCSAIIKVLDDDIKDEAKAHKDYIELAQRVKELLCVGQSGEKCPLGGLADETILSISTDEEKHRKLIQAMYELVHRECYGPYGSYV